MFVLPVPRWQLVRVDGETLPVGTASDFVLATFLALAGIVGYLMAKYVYAPTYAGRLGTSLGLGIGTALTGAACMARYAPPRDGGRGGAGPGVQPA